MKKLLSIVSTLFVTTLLVSCGGKQEENLDEFKPSLDTNTKCEIKVVGSYDNFEALEKKFDEFNEFYPHVSLSYEKKDKYDENIATFLVGDKPNIFFAQPKYMGKEYVSVVEHMEDLSDPALKINVDCIRPNLLNQDNKGKVLMVPIFSRTYGMIVNKDLFQKEGLNIPTTLTEFLNVCNAFREKGYKSPLMGYSNYDIKKDKDGNITAKNVSNGLMNTVVYPLVVAELAKNKEALDLANNLDSRAGEYMRKALETMKQLLDAGNSNLTECDKIGDSYNKTLLRFLDGDVPMMACNGDTVSGAKKRETKSEAYQANPFNYSYYPIPLAEQGGYFIDSPSVEFAVNKDCDNLDMTNEFMRFLIRTSVLDSLSVEKGLINTTKTTPFATPVYAPFNDVPPERTIAPEVIGIKDQTATQIKNAAFYVGRGDLTIDEVVARYGTLPNDVLKLNNN